MFFKNKFRVSIFNMFAIVTLNRKSFRSSVVQSIIYVVFLIAKTVPQAVTKWPRPIKLSPPGGVDKKNTLKRGIFYASPRSRRSVSRVYPNDKSIILPKTTFTKLVLEHKTRTLLFVCSKYKHQFSCSSIYETRSFSLFLK